MTSHCKLFLNSQVPYLEPLYLDTLKISGNNCNWILSSSYSLEILVHTFSIIAFNILSLASSHFEVKLNIMECSQFYNFVHGTSSSSPFQLCSFPVVLQVDAMTLLLFIEDKSSKTTLWKLELSD